MGSKKRHKQRQAQASQASQFPQKPATHVYHFDTRMTYGKHGGYTMGEILKLNPGYIVWMHREGMNISKKLYEEAAKALKIRLADNIRYQRAQRALYPGNVMPEACPKVFPEIDLLQYDYEPIVDMRP